MELSQAKNIKIEYQKNEKHAGLGCVLMQKIGKIHLRG